MEQIQQQFLRLQPAQLQWAHDFYVQESSIGLAPTQISQDLSEEIKKRFGFSPEESSKIVKILFPAISSPSFDANFIDIASPDLQLTEFDYSSIIALLQDNSEADPAIISLLLSFVSFYRYNFHPSGWIHYDRKNIFHLAGLSKLSSAKQEELTKHLHNCYELEMQVVGSNNPIPCFGFSWLREQPQVNDATNPLKTLGPLSPATIQTLTTKIQKEALKHD